ncbi:MAG TPA: type II toxin-antitoxin system RelE/ParE family toxin [Verrucomicrobiae bacterium]|jgi:plasmid stabilization system protein ParE
MKRRVRPAFYRDMAEQELWLLENAGPEVADRWHEALWKAIDFLEQQPFIGRERHDLKHPRVRSWRIKHFERWLIFYGVRDDALIFYRVVSGTTNLFQLRIK